MGVRVLKSIAVPSVADRLETVAHIHQIEPHVDGILLDSHWRGGTGETSDISMICQLCAQIRGNVVVAGGIGESNLNSYLSALHPYAIDVESSVEWQFNTQGQRITAKSVSKIGSLLGLLRRLADSKA
jgi:phosphoribosylanthranilate isomerase